MESSLIKTSNFSIKDKQTEAIIKMLNLNSPGDEMRSSSRDQEKKESWEDQWKILVYDSYCRDIISPLLRVGELRKRGVTLHLMLNGDRHPVWDVPAVYFVLPTRSNIQRIAEDCKNKMYDYYYLNFASSIPSPLLEELASSVVETDASQQIVKVCDQYLNFISLEKNLFTLNSKDSYIKWNDPTVTDTQAEEDIECIVNALFSVLVTLGVVPIIRCPKNGAAEAVASQLDAKLHDHLLNDMNSNLFSESSSFSRPVLILLDRSTDLTVPLHHSWTYQSLVHDLLNLHLNRVQVEVKDNESAKTELKSYDLDAADSFWTDNVGTPFPNIAEAVDGYLKDYKSALDEFNKLSGGADIDNFDESKLLGKTKDLGSFVSMIPALHEKKRIIDVHTNIATTLLNQIKARELDAFFSMEEGIMTRSLYEKRELMSLLTDSKRGTVEDKLRLLLIYYLSSENIPAAELEQITEALAKQGADVSPLKFLKKIKAFNASVVAASASSAASAATSLSSNYTSTVKGFFQKASNLESFGLGGAVTSQLGALFAAGFKSLLPTTKEFYITRIVDAIVEMKNELGVENYLYFDPKVQKKLRSSAIPRKNTPFKEAIVFVIGGGNYLEYHTLQDYSKKHPAKKILYGSTEILTANEFLRQLTELSKKIS